MVDIICIRTHLCFDKGECRKRIGHVHAIAAVRLFATVYCIHYGVHQLVFIAIICVIIQLSGRKGIGVINN